MAVLSIRIAGRFEPGSLSTDQEDEYPSFGREAPFISEIQTLSNESVSRVSAGIKLWGLQQEATEKRQTAPDDCSSLLQAAAYASRFAL
jgi:hypothetical protein